MNTTSLTPRIPYKRLWSLKEVCDQLSMNKRAVMKLVDAGILHMPHGRLPGSKVYITNTSIEKYVGE